MSTFSSQNRTDLASELIKAHTTRVNDLISRTVVTVDEKTSSLINKPPGKYVTLLSPVVTQGFTEQYPRLVRAIKNSLEKMVKGRKNCLVVGLGNRKMTADSLGEAVISRVVVTGEGGVRTFCPQVSGVTGIESYDAVCAIVGKIKPEVVIAVDSLCAASQERLGTAFQLTDTGITPGSGVNNARARLDKTALGVDVISIGVPLVVYASTLGAKKEDELIVTPKDVDLLVQECATIIANSINATLR
ncbi:MAG: GPR endopeptidase [Clostridia bacterium]|nr:GPR endopeptidase [Clostridia bacterium]